MKRFALLLAILVFAVACTDATAPTGSSMSLSPPTTLRAPGNLPPPPADAVIEVSVNSDPLFGQFTGVYFANGANVEATVAAQLVGDESLAFLGTAWLRFDNNQTLGPSASANARFQRTDQKLSGNGSLVIGGRTIRIDEVTSFAANPTCYVFGEACAVITFNATVDGESGHTGRAEAFNKDACILITPTEVSSFNTAAEGSSYYVCRDQEID